MSVENYSEWYESHRSGIEKDYFSFLKFKSISSEPEFKSEVLSCSRWLKAYLEKVGLSVEVWEKEGHPVLFATYNSSKPNAPTLLLYNHYDVQPVDPLELWESEPFEPTLRDGIVYARGASDNKGQCFYVITAVRAFLEKAKAEMMNLKMIIEGEEEMGSETLSKLLEEKKDELKADHFIVIDVDLPAKGVPGITLGMRGIVTFDVTVIGANQDLHSGNHGGLAYNPLKALCQTLSSFWAADGTIAIHGFYDDLEELDKKELKQFFLDFDEGDYQKRYGVRAIGAESGSSPIEANWLRPCIEINGMKGGYTGEGFKTIIPAKASAKISCRLPPRLDPEKVTEQITDFLQKNCPEGMELIIEAHGGGAGYRASPDSEIAQIAAKAYESVYGGNCRFILTGGSIPIAEKLVKVSEAETILMGTALMSDNIHSPNEHFALSRLREGFLIMTQILEQLAI